MTLKTNEKKRVQFALKLTESNYAKLRDESSKLEITMSAFMSMLIANYKGLDIKYNNNDTSKR